MTSTLSFAASTFTNQATAAAAADVAAPLAELRREGAAAFARLGFPTMRNEDWHYTSVRAIADASFVSSGERATSPRPSPSDLQPYVFGGDWPLLVFHNGRFASDASSMRALPDGVRVLSLARAVTEAPELLQAHLGATVAAERDGFSALNAAFAGEGTLIHVSKEMVSDTPIHLLHVVDAAGANVMAHPRHVIVVERHAKATVIESYVSLTDARYFTNAVTEVSIADGANLSHGGRT